MARPQCDIAQAGSAADAALNSLAASSYQKECKSAIPFSNSTCAFALQEVAKATRPMSPGAAASWWWECSTCAGAYWVGNANRTAHVSTKARIDMLSSDGTAATVAPWEIQVKATKQKAQIKTGTSRTSPFYLPDPDSCLGADDHTSRIRAALGRLRMNRGAGPALRGTRSGGGSNGYVLRGAEALEGRRHRRSASEVRAVVVGGVLLFVGREVAKVRLHRSDISLVFGIGKLRDRNRGKNADDDDYDQKLDQGEALLIAHCVS